MTPDDLMRALRSVRLKLRLLLLTDGLAQLLAWTAAFFAVFTFLDWWVHFPGYVRFVVAGSGGLWAAVWIVRRIARPMLAAISLDQLALRLGQLTPKARDRLASAVAYMRSGGRGSPQLWQRVITNTLNSVGEVPLASGLSPRRTVHSGLIAVLAAALIFSFSAWSPSTVSIGWRRLVRPLTSTQWPRRVDIESLSGGGVVAYGESFTARMRLRRGDDPDLRAYLLWVQPGGEQQHFLMRRTADGIYHHTVDGLTLPARYAFEAGDDDTRDQPCTLQVVHRPAVDSARFLFQPPHYARSPADSERASPEPIIQPLEDSPVVAVVGSHARLEVVSNRSLYADGTPRQSTESSAQHNQVRFEDGHSLALHPIDDDGKTLVAEFTVARGGSFQIVLIDANGLQSRDGRRYQLLVREDQEPRVVLTAPSSNIELTPRGVLNLAARATDDFGIESVRLLAGLNGAGMTEVADLLEQQPDHDDAESGSATQVDIEHAFRLGDWTAAGSRHELKPGDVIEYVVEASDRFELDGRRHGPARTSRARVHVVSEAELEEILRQSLSDARRPLQQLVARLLALRNQTEALDRGPSLDRSLSDDEKEQAERLARQLDRLAADGRRSSDRLDRLLRRAEANMASHTDVALQADRLARMLSRLTGEPMKRAISALSRAAEAGEPDAQHDQLVDAVQTQDQMIASMRRMLNQMDRWNEFADVVRLTRALLDRQEALIREVKQLGRQLGGQAVAELQADQRSDLLQTVAGQSQLKADAAALARNAGQLATSLAAKDGPAAESLMRAIEMFGQRAVADEMETATGEIRQNRMNRALPHQERAASGLRAMLEALSHKPDRQLAELSRELDDVLGRLGRLIHAQQELIDRSLALESSPVSEKDRSDAAIDLAQRQTSIAQTTGRVEAGIKPTESEAVEAKADLSAAVSQMETAAARLEGNSTNLAVESENLALESLRSALVLLQSLRERTDSQMAERSLAAILESLVDLRRSQAALRIETGVVEGHRQEQGRISRVDGLKLNGMAKQQRALLEPLRAVRARILTSVVYQHVCDRLEEDIGAAADRMTAHDCAEALTYQGSVLRNLDRLIRAIEDRPTKRGKQFVDAGGGGGGPGAATISKPVPTLAELKVLRMLQEELSTRTRQLNETLPDPLLRSEAQLVRIQHLGIEQREVHSLAVKMIQAAAQPAPAPQGGP